MVSTCAQMHSGSRIGIGIRDFADASGDEYPARTATIIVSQAAGGGNDILTRLFAERLQTRLGKRVVVENRVGAGGMIGATAGAKAAPDGYTLLLLTNADVINQFMHRNVSYDVQRDFAPISLLATAPLVLLTNGTLPIKTLPDLVAYAKANPKSLSYGTPGVGTPHHISGEMLQKATKIELNHVTYRGTAPSLNDLRANQIPLIIATTISVMPHLQERKVFPIVTADQKRSSVLRDVPTLGEAEEIPISTAEVPSRDWLPRAERHWPSSIGSARRLRPLRRRRRSAGGCSSLATMSLPARPTRSPGKSTLTDGSTSSLSLSLASLPTSRCQIFSEINAVWDRGAW